MINPKLLVPCSNPHMGDLCHSFLKEDITYASVGLIVGRSISGVFSDSKWQETYVNFSLFHHDPAFHAATQVSGVPIMWS